MNDHVQAIFYMLVKTSVRFHILYVFFIGLAIKLKTLVKNGHFFQKKNTFVNVEYISLCHL